MGQLILDPDDRDTWGEQVQNKLHPTPPTGVPVPKVDRHAFLLRQAELEVERMALLESGACHWCYGTDFWEATPGNWICAKCHPPSGTPVTLTTANKSESGKWVSKTVDLN